MEEINQANYVGKKPEEIASTSKPKYPPGYRFMPKDEELIVDYLWNKINNQPIPLDEITQVFLYQHNPQSLADAHPQLGEKEWYFFTPRDRKYQNGSRPSRSAGNGYWKATGSDKSISFEGQIVGFKKSLVFHEGRPPAGTKTNWIMHEYRANQPARQKTGPTDMRLDDWVLCRIYIKSERSNNKPKRNDEEEKEEEEEEKVVAENIPENNNNTNNNNSHINNVETPVFYNVTRDNTVTYNSAFNNSSPPPAYLPEDHYRNIHDPSLQVYYHHQQPNYNDHEPTYTYFQNQMTNLAPFSSMQSEIINFAPPNLQDYYDNDYGYNHHHNSFPGIQEWEDSIKPDLFEPGHYGDVLLDHDIEDQANLVQGSLSLPMSSGEEDFMAVKEEDHSNDPDYNQLMPRERSHK